MKKPIIEIQRASEELVQNLIELGVLVVGSDNALHVSEQVGAQEGQQC